MKPGIAASRFHEALVHDVMAVRPSEEEVLCAMLLLHACRIVLSQESNVEGGGRGFAPITTRHAAEVVATLFPGEARGRPEYWYWKWNGDWDAYAILESVPEGLAPRLPRVRRMIESHPWVERLEDEDWPLTPV